MIRIQAKRIIFSWPVLVLLLLVFLIVLRSDLKVYLANRSIEKSVIQKEKELKKIIKEKEELKKEVERLDNPAYVEKILRERFRAKKPGEKLLIIMEEEPAESSPEGRATSTTLFRKVLKFLKIKN